MTGTWRDCGTVSEDCFGFKLYRNLPLVHSISFLYPLSPLPQSPLKKKAAASKAGAQDDLLLLFDDGLSNASSMAQHSAPLMPSMDHMLTPMTAALDINGGGGRSQLWEEVYGAWGHY